LRHESRIRDFLCVNFGARRAGLRSVVIHALASSIVIPPLSFMRVLRGVVK